MSFKRIQVDALVRLNQDVPLLLLRRGDEGIVVSIWLLPGDLIYEVEFEQPSEPSALRALLRAEQLEVVTPVAGGVS